MAFLFDLYLGEMIRRLLTICTSSSPWAHSAVEGPGSRCDSWCHSHHTAASGQDLWPGRRPRTLYTPGNASLYLAPPWWSVKVMVRHLYVILHMIEWYLCSVLIILYVWYAKSIINVPLCQHRMDGSTGHTEHRPKDGPLHQGQNSHTPHTCPKRQYIMSYPIWLRQCNSDNEILILELEQPPEAL